MVTLRMLPTCTMAWISKNSIKMLKILNKKLNRIPNWSIYFLLTLPSVYYFYLAINGTLSVEPVKALEHELGALGLKLIILILAITPLRNHLNLNLFRFRRAIGIMAYYYILLHFLVCLLYTSPSPRDATLSRMPSSA